jgi:hypothetical protein
MVSWGPNYDGGGLTGLGSGVAAATSQGPDHGDDLAPGRSSGDGSSLTMRWGPDLEKQQWHRGALTVVTVASQGLAPVAASCHAGASQAGGFSFFSS